VAFSPKLVNGLQALVKKAEGKAKPVNGKRSLEAVAVELVPLVVDGVKVGGELAWAFSAAFEAALPTVAAADVAAIVATAGFAVPIIGTLFATVAVAWFLMGSTGAFTLPSTSLGIGGGGDDRKKCGTPDDAVSAHYTGEQHGVQC
jgi:hypothetical protein